VLIPGSREVGKRHSGDGAILDSPRLHQRNAHMAKETRMAKRPEIAQPTATDFARARSRLRQRADTLIVELAKRYHAGKSEELTAVLNAMDSATELERMEPSAVPER
jgi:hypothetical protein